MQPKSTPRKSWLSSAKIIAIALIFLASTQISFAQNKSAGSVQQKPGYENILNNFQKQQFQQAKAGIKDNDAGILRKVSHEINNPAATCTTWTFSIVAGDPTMTTRPFRDGIVKTCAAPGGPCQAGVAGSFHYKIFQWVNPVAQCVTVTYNATNANFSFVTVYNASPNLANLCQNWVTDAGSSATVGTPIVFSFNGTAGTTYYFLVDDVGVLTADGTIQIDAGVCSSAPCTGTPAPGNTIATPNPVGSGAPFTLSVANNPAVSGLVHTFQKSTTGAAPWTTIANGPSNTFVTTQAAVTFYRDSVFCTATSQSGISNPVQVQLLACGWSASTVYPITILDQANVTVGTNLYSFAGVTNGVLTANAYKFDGTVWTAIAPVPQPLEYPSAVTDGANIYILGGANTVGAGVTNVYKYTIATNSYTALAPFTVGTWNQSAVCMGGKIYKFCGTGAAASVANLEIYDIAGNSWTAGPAYPIAESFVSAIAQGGFIYAGGGVNTTTLTATNKTYRYNPAGAGLWEDAPIADLTNTYWGSASDFYNNQFVVAGGYFAGVTNVGVSAIEWDQASGAWTPLPDMPTAAARMGGAAMGGAFYVPGGRTIASAGFNGSNQNQKLFCIPPTPCSGTPAPGNTIASTNPVCSGVSFTLSLANNPFVSGLTYQWQSSPNNVTYTNILGATSITYTGSQIGATWYRCIVSCTPSGLSGTSNPVLVADGQGVFNSHPASLSIQCGGNATFAFTATGNSLTYGWEFKVSAASVTWFNVTPGSPLLFGAGVSGETTQTLTLTNVSGALNGYQFRGTILGPCTAVDFSNIATLTVTPYIVTVSPPSATICAGTLQKLSITNTVSGALTASFASTPINILIPDGDANPTLNTINVSAIPAGSLITDIRVHLNLSNHTYPADMIINLKGPNAVSSILSLYKHNTNTDNGAASVPGAGFYDAVTSKLGTVVYKNVPTPFKYGQTAPTGPFKADALNGVTNPGYVIVDPTGYASNVLTFDACMPIVSGQPSPNGTWTMAMCDGGAGDVGTWNNWSIDIDYVAPVFAQGVWTSSPAAPNTMWATAAGSGGPAYVAGTPATSIWVNPIVNTNYTVVVTTATPCVSAPTVVPVTVYTPITAVVAPLNKTVCVGTNASFTVSATGGPLTYQWEVSTNNGLTWSVISGATSATLTLTAVTQLMNNNLYRVTVLSGPCATSGPYVARLNTNQLPIVTISSTVLQLVPGRVATITGTSVPAPFSATSWSWTLNGSAISGATTNTVTANIDQQGAYRATVTDINGCTNSSNIVTIGSQASDYLWIYPNPNSGQFQVRLYYNGAIAEVRKVRIYNAGGQLVAQQEFVLTSGTAPYLSMSFNLPQLAAGTYAVKVVDKNEKQITSGLMVIQ